VMDAAVVDERSRRHNPDLDLFNETNGPPYPPDFLSRYAAQVHATRITTGSRKSSNVFALRFSDRPFSVMRTWRPRMIDPNIDPSKRPPTSATRAYPSSESLRARHRRACTLRNC